MFDAKDLYEAPLQEIEDTPVNNKKNTGVRRRRSKKNKKEEYYFGDREEEFFRQYIKSTNPAERDKIFREILYPAFSKMVESIIRTYRLFTPDEDFDITFADTMSHLVTKLQNFDVSKGNVIINDKKYVFRSTGLTFEEKVDNSDSSVKKVKSKKTVYPLIDNVVVIDDIPYTLCGDTLVNGDNVYTIEKHKVYSYCGTVCKNYLIYKRDKFDKQQKKYLTYEAAFGVGGLAAADNDEQRVIDTDDEELKFNEELIQTYIWNLQDMLDPNKKSMISVNERNIGHALLDLLLNWEDIFCRMGSNKFNKTSFFYFLREYTHLETPQIRDALVRYRDLYYLIKEDKIKEE